MNKGIKKESSINKDWIVDLGAILLMLIAAVFIRYNMAWVNSIEGDGGSYNFYPYTLAAKSLYNFGEMPLWMPSIWGGLAGFHNFTSPSFNPIALLAIPFFYSTSDGFLSFQLLEALHIIYLWILQIGVYYMCRVSGISKGVAFFAATVCALCGDSGWVNFKYGLSWAPLLIACLLLLTRKKTGGSVIATGVVYAMALITHLAQGAVLLTLLWAMLFLFIIIENHKNMEAIKRITLRHFVAGCIGVGLVAVFLFPVLMQSDYNYRFVPEMGFLKPDDKITFSIFIKHGLSASALRNMEGGYFGDLSAGFPALVAIVLGLFSRKADVPEQRILLNFGKLVLAFAIIGGFGFLFPDFLFYIPFVNQIRETFLYPMVYYVGSAVVGAMGAFQLVKCISSRQPLSVYFYNVPLLITLLVAILCVAFLPHKFGWSAAIGLLLLGSIILGARQLKGRWKNATLLLLLLTLTAHNVYSLRNTPGLQNGWTSAEAANQMKVAQSSVRQLFEQTEWPTSENPFRVTSYSSKKVWPETVMADIGGYDTMGYWNPLYSKTVEQHNNLSFPKRLHLKNVKYWFIAEEDMSKNPEDFGCKYIGLVTDVFPYYGATEPHNVKVFENIKAPGPAWFVYDFAFYQDGQSPEQIFAQLNQPEIDVLTTALLNEKDAQAVNDITPTSNMGQVQMKAYRNNSIEMVCSTENKGMLVIAESDSPGWVAYVDGVKTEILSADYDRRAIVIPPGEHSVKLIYRPKAFVVGGIVSISVVLLILAYGIFKLIGYINMRKNSKLINAQTRLNQHYYKKDL